MPRISASYPSMRNQILVGRSPNRFRLLAAFMLACLGLSLLTSSAARAAEEPLDTKGFVDVIDVGGYIDRVNRDFLLQSIDEAVANKSEALVIKLNSPGSLLAPAELDALETAIRDEKRIPIAVWVGGLDARAKGGAVRIVRAADIVGVGPRTKIGNSTAALSGDEPLMNRLLDDRAALKEKVATIDAPVLVDFVGQLDGKVVAGKKLDTAEPVKLSNGRQGAKPYGVRFAKLGLLPRLLHMATSPSIAYFFLVVAFALFVFEFFTGGVGVAAGVGLMAFVLAASGLGNLPTRPLGLILLLVSMLGFAIDIQAGTPRFWTAVGAISFVVGSLTMYANGIRVPLYWVALVTVMIVLFMVNGMPTMVRTRFATPTIGREGMIGEEGNARGAVDPDGVVEVKGAMWRARTNRATPIGAGEGIRVVAIDGLLLEVEPLEGGAKDAGH